MSEEQGTPADGHGAEGEEERNPRPGGPAGPPPGYAPGRGGTPAQGHPTGQDGAPGGGAQPVPGEQPGPQPPGPAYPAPPHPGPQYPGPPRQPGPPQYPGQAYRGPYIHPGQSQYPSQPSPGVPQPYPGSPQQYPGAPGQPPSGAYPPGHPGQLPAPLHPQQAKAAGGGIPGGLGVGCAAIFAAFVLALVLSGSVNNFLVLNIPSVLAVALGVALMFQERWRRFGAGILIMVCIFWIVVVGPCTAILSNSIS